MKKLVYSITFLLVLTLLFGGLTTYARTSDAPKVELNDRYIQKSDRTLAADRVYSLPKKGIYRVEKGSTLVVEGELQVLGTLKNYGTIIVKENPVPQDLTLRRETTLDPTEVTRGRLVVSGKLENYGEITVTNAHIENRTTGYIKNEGTITLENDVPELTVMRNTGRSTGSGTTGGELENTEKGIINVATEAGTGLYIQEGSTFKNKGHLVIYKGAIAKGKFLGNRPLYFELTCINP